MLHPFYIKKNEKSMTSPLYYLLLILFLSWLLGMQVPLVLGYWVNLKFAKINYNRMPRN